MKKDEFIALIKNICKNNNLTIKEFVQMVNTSDLVPTYDSNYIKKYCDTIL